MYGTKRYRGIFIFEEMVLVLVFYSRCQIQTTILRPGLVEVTQDFTSGVATTSLLMIHDTSRGGEDDETELTGGQETSNPLLNLVQLDVETGRDNTSLVDASNELNDNLSRAVVINLLKLANVTCRIRIR